MRRTVHPFLRLVLALVVGVGVFASSSASAERLDRKSVV